MPKTADLTFATATGDARLVERDFRPLALAPDIALEVAHRFHRAAAAGPLPIRHPLNAARLLRYPLGCR